MRLFISIDFPDDILEEIRSWIPDQKGWKKVQKHQMHLTLAFLGECSEEEKEDVHTILSDIEFFPFQITIGGLGTFPNESVPRVIWVGIEPNEELMMLQEKISYRLKDFFKIKSKNAHSYVPHVTLARKKSQRGINQIVKQNLKRETPLLNTYIEAFNLKKSILKSAGSEHQILHRYGAISTE